MAMRIKIGTGAYSYIIDADGDSSTTSGVTLLADSSHGLDGTPTPLSWNVSNEGAEVRFTCHINAASVAALKTARDAFETAMIAPTGDVLIESTDDTTLKSFATSTYGYIRQHGSVTFYDGELDCLADVTLRFEKAPVAEGGDFNPTGLTGGVNMDVERTIGGMLSIILTARFVGGGGNTAKTNAYTFIANVKYRTSTPAYIDSDDTTDIRVIGDSVEFDLGATSGIAAETATVRIMLQQVPSALASSTALQLAAIKSISYTVDAVTRPLVSGAGMPGLEVSVSGVIQAKTEGFSTYDSNDSAPAALTDAQFVAAIEAIKSAAETNMGTTFTVLSVRRARGTDGAITFAMNGISSHSVIVTWNESITINTQSSETILPDTSGKEWIYAGPIKGTQHATHALTVEKILSAHAYAVPPIFADWRQGAMTAEAPVKLRQYTGTMGGGTVDVYRTSYMATYRKLEFKAEVVAGTLETSAQITI